MSHIFVSGANGFVGKALCPHLKERGFRTRSLLRTKAGRTSTGTSDVFVIDEIGPTTNWGSAFDGIETVVHLAARVHVVQDLSRDPLGEFRKVNVFGTERLALHAARAGVKRLVFVSSIKVNGEQTFGKPFSELDPPDPKDHYGMSKWEAEQALHRVAIQTGLEIVILRPPLVYGPGVKGNFLSMLNAIRLGIPLPFGGILNSRSLLYLENLVDAIVLCIKHPSAIGQTFLVSDGDAISTSELLLSLSAVLDTPQRIFPLHCSILKFGGGLIGKRAALERLLGSLVVDDSKIRSQLGWRTPFSLSVGLEKTGAWFKGDHARN
jgi:nucleoside-diphosphate-sugar epimerase